MYHLLNTYLFFKQQKKCQRKRKYYWSEYDQDFKQGFRHFNEHRNVNARVGESSQEQNQARVGQENHCGCQRPQCHGSLENVLSLQVRRDVGQRGDVATPFNVVGKMSEISPLLNGDLVQFFHHVNADKDHNQNGSSG